MSQLTPPSSSIGAKSKAGGSSQSTPKQMTEVKICACTLCNQIPCQHLSVPGSDLCAHCKDAVLSDLGVCSGCDCVACRTPRYCLCPGPRPRSFCVHLPMIGSAFCEFCGPYPHYVEHDMADVPICRCPCNLCGFMPSPKVVSPCGFRVV